jgi:hypothetical protein
LRGRKESGSEEKDGEGEREVVRRMERKEGELLPPSTSSLLLSLPALLLLSTSLPPSSPSFSSLPLSLPPLNPLPPHYFSSLIPLRSLP